jgi:urease accessory protein
MMPVALTEVGRRGRLDLSFAQQNGRTVLRDSYCEVPFKITRILNAEGPVPHLILMQCTAGLFGGDDVKCSIRVERGARVRITQQSATKVHPSQDRVAIQRNHVVVEDGADLQLYLEPLIPFAGSHLKQSTLLEIHAGGRLSFWEGFMTGRVGSGESWQFMGLESETKLCVNGKLAYLDRFRLRPHEVPPSRWTMGAATHLGTGLYVGSEAADVASRLHRILPGAGVDTLAENVAIARVVSTSGPAFQRAREQFCLHVGNNPATKDLEQDLGTALLLQRNL